MRYVSDETREYAAEKIDKALVSLVPRAGDEEILDFFKERLQVARDEYGEFLSVE